MFQQVWIQLAQVLWTNKVFPKSGNPYNEWLISEMEVIFSWIRRLNQQVVLLGIKSTAKFLSQTFLAYWPYIVPIGNILTGIHLLWWSWYTVCIPVISQHKVHHKTNFCKWVYRNCSRRFYFIFEAEWLVLTRFEIIVTICWASFTVVVRQYSYKFSNFHLSTQ